MRLIIIGAGGHGKVIADIAKNNGYTDIAFLDDDENIHSCSGYNVIGTTNAFSNYSERDFIVAVGNNEVREKIQKKLINEKINVVTLIHPKATIADNVSIGKGTVIMAGAVVNPETSIGNGCIINTGATVDHDNLIGDYVHISVGSHLAGMVHIGEKTWIGAGAIINNCLSVISNCMVGSGAVVVKNINEVGTYIGIPARKWIEDSMV